MKAKFTIFVIICCTLLAVYVVQQQQPIASADVETFTLDQQITKCGTSVFQLTGFDSSRQVAPKLDNLGNHHLAITTSDDKAQYFFDQGLRLTYAFNHAEAHRSFMEAARLDPNAAMAYWGQAYALGPNINDPFPDDNRKMEAAKAAKKAKALSANSTEKERDLIEALTFRYSDDVEADIEELNRSYMMAMEKIANKYPEDAEIQTLFGEAVMNTMPWNYWTNDGKPNEHTLKAKKALEKAIELNPDHPGAHHYYIHLVELPKPDLAISSAEKLGTMMPGAGHLVHMPSHIFIRVGRYIDAVEANKNAIKADEDYISQCYSQGLYPLAYYPHNIHFLWSAASLMGDSKTAIEAARKTAERVPTSEMVNLPFLQDYASTPILAYVRFGKWDNLLTIPYPGKDLKHLALIWHFGRGTAFVRKQNLKEAKEELEAIQGLKKDPDLKDLIANYTNPSSKIAAVAYEVLAGEIAMAEGNLDEAIAHLRKGVQNQDELAYSEPAAWHVPVRQTLGLALLKAGRAEDAEAVYREDLKNIRGNGWSLMGLHKCLKAQGKNMEADNVEKKFREAWTGADVQITSSVL